MFPCTQHKYILTMKAMNRTFFVCEHHNFMIIPKDNDVVLLNISTSKHKQHIL